MVEEKEIRQAIEGDKHAVERIVRDIKDLVFNLSLKMLLYPEDAEDATQEILLKVFTRLSTFRFDAAFETWVYRIATNSLLTYRGKLSDQFRMNFDEYAETIDRGHDSSLRFGNTEQERRLLVEEVKVSCTHGLLLCLKPKARVIFILGDILEFDSKTGGQIAGTTPESFRKTLSRSRKKLQNFLNRKCGLFQESNPCRCIKKVNYLVDSGAINATSLRFARHTNQSIKLLEGISEAEKLAATYRHLPKREFSISKSKELLELITGAFQ